MLGYALCFLLCTCALQNVYGMHNFFFPPITYFVFVMHSWSHPRNCERDVISPIVKPVSPRMHHKNEGLIEIRFSVRDIKIRRMF